MTTLIRWLIFCAVGTIVVVNGEKQDYDEDAVLQVPQLIAKYGYTEEDHTVITEDGYVLTMFRILPRRQPITRKKPVLLVHALLTSSADYVIGGPNNSLAFLLADNGYDVWLANSRGSTYSKGHLRLPVESKEYWDFSWHEMGYYDQPAMIDHVLNATNSEKLFYLGHSQGVTLYFIMTSTRPEYNGKIALMTALSPAISWKHSRSPFLKIIKPFVQPGSNTISTILDALKIFEFLPHNENGLRIVQPLCPPTVKNNVCIQIYGLVAGPNPNGTDPKLILSYLGHIPQGASVKQVLHLAQSFGNGGTLRQFDHGRSRNLERYGRPEPPTYNLTASTAPVLIYYGLNDWLVDSKDARELPRMLPQVIAAIPVADRKFNHMDFVLAKNVRTMLYEKILPVLDQYNR